MSLVFTIIIATLSLSMFFLRREQKMMLLWFSLLCLDVFPQIKTVGVVLNIPTCFLLSESSIILRTLRNYNQSWLKVILVVISLSMIVLFFASPHSRELGITGFISIIEFELIQKYFFIVYGLSCIVSMGSMKSLLNVTTVGILILTFFGLLNLILGHPVFLEYMFSNVQDLSSNHIKALNDVAGMSDRMRIRSMFMFPFDYGYICLLSLLFSWYCMNERIGSKLQCWVVIACALFGIIFCACRSVYVCAIIAIACYVLFAFRHSRRFVTILSILLINFIAIQFVPQLKEVAHLAGSVFDANSDVEGSTWEKREESATAVFYYVQNNIYLGRGRGFYGQDLGALSGSIASDVHGIENVLLFTLLERGIFGLVAYLLFYIVLLVNVNKMRYRERVSESCCLSILIAYIVFSNLTGELGSVAPTLFLVGAFFKVIHLKNIPYAKIKLY